jgi:hypothetical protein
MSEWTLLSDITYESACEHGARWIRHIRGVVESFTLSGAAIEKLGYLPTPADAYDHFRMGEQYRRLMGDRARVIRVLDEDDAS